MTMTLAGEKKTNKGYFALLVVYLALDYGRIHDTFGFGFARPLMIMTLILIWMIIKSGGFEALRIRQVRMMTLFILLLALHVPFARNTFYAYHATRAMFLYMPFIIGCIICLNSIERLKHMLLVCVAIMAYVSMYAITHHGRGPGAYFADENDLSLYINMWIPFCFFLFSVEQSRAKKIFLVTSMVLGLLAIVASVSRGGIVGLIAVFFVIWIFSRRKVASLFVIAVLGLLIIAFSDEGWRREMATMTDMREHTAKERIESWKSGWKMFLDNPLGVGGNNFLVRFQEYQTEYFQRGMYGRAAHSLWFTLMPELGIAGIVIYMLLLYYNIKDILFLKSIDSKGTDEDRIYLNHVGRGLIGSLAGFFASASFLSVLYYAHYWYLTGLIVAAVRIPRSYSRENGTAG